MVNLLKNLMSRYVLFSLSQASLVEFEEDIMIRISFEIALKIIEVEKSFFVL